MWKYRLILNIFAGVVLLPCAWAAGVVSPSLHHLLLAKLYLVIVQKKLRAAKDIVLADRAVYICVQHFGQIF